MKHSNFQIVFVPSSNGYINSRSPTRKGKKGKQTWFILTVQIQTSPDINNLTDTYLFKFGRQAIIA